ncbi:hypothetical protein LSCM1_01238 [Leishmania martiniquensis]|uniref:Uncharacterized protein n=1 Tax=Leishmania martiniquensis TaxID=1580590 RepID=A0A836GGB5_9TRYP|nr:hypothetical protein LSCM1_01238 [Leishmania martiniquensis]
MDAIIKAVYTIDPIYMVASAVAQQMLAVAWFDCIVRQIDRYYVAADKGVRRVEHAITRYPGQVISGATFLCALLRSVVVLTLVSICKCSTLYQYQSAAMIAVMIGMMRVHRTFSCHRPIQIFVTETGYEMAAAMTAAVVCYYMKMYNF